MFGLILGGSKGIENYPAFLLTGMFVFTYTQRTVTAGAKSISGNLSLIRALHFPRASLPLAYTIQELQQLVISMGVLLVIVVITNEPVTLRWLMIPIVLVLQTMFNIGAGLILARLGASLRDLNQLLPFIMRTWLYASGVFFAIHDKVVNSAGLPEWVATAMYLNPAASYIEWMRGPPHRRPHPAAARVGVVPGVGGRRARRRVLVLLAGRGPVRAGLTVTGAGSGGPR
ncbi:hypothetical protein GCM10020220_005330 [Nonomuraea rubra]